MPRGVPKTAISDDIEWKNVPHVHPHRLGVRVTGKALSPVYGKGLGEPGTPMSTSNTPFCQPSGK
jgi:hypothetical protein